MASLMLKAKRYAQPKYIVLGLLIIYAILLFIGPDDEDQGAAPGARADTAAGEPIKEVEAPGIYELDFLNELIEEVTGIDKLLKAVASGKVQTDRILYNRVPKCSSTTLRYIFGDLATANNFNLEVSNNFAQEAVNDTGEGEVSMQSYCSIVFKAFEISCLAEKVLTDEVKNLKVPSLYIRHVFFVDFQKHDRPNPIYINLVRDPIDRLVSDYYFKRFQLQNVFPMPEERRKRTYDECVFGMFPECVAPTPKGFFRIIPYFCGQDEKCFTPSQWALDRAKENVIKHYLVVGMSEDVDKFLEVLDMMMPTFFKKGREMYESKLSFFKEKFKSGKIPPTNRTISIMKDMMEYDYHFYEFVRQRFFTLYNRLKKLPMDPTPPPLR
ncbi:hypothetical protein CAPTEDRAFT_223508 [Capitella teleta]|uniref:Sulfotransferase domain-containing protein n=1 Tax=Capitella teleta TaxID=283909 RepID=R7UEI1_CAPTE|nr:hypothetical protein CAPTEDRAFT_223508 [Capitella teleta]|eukprot:ELU04384.1 hypothetical protein CAPTEDRAFT_223508 [Capitella teleta]